MYNRSKKVDDLLVAVALRLHQFHRQAEQAPGLVAHHLKILVFARARQCVAPEQIHPLSPVQVD